MEHLSREAIEAMVMNVPAPGVAEARRHLSRCASCASRLEREAQLEMLLHSAAESAGDVTATPESPWWLARPWIVQAAALVILAGGALWLGHARHLAAPPAQTPQPGQQGRVSPAREFTAPGSDVESPRDFGMRTEPYVPCLEPGATTRPHASDSL